MYESTLKLPSTDYDVDGYYGIIPRPGFNYPQVHWPLRDHRKKLCGGMCAKLGI
jgi:hypothetical protein